MNKFLKEIGKGTNLMRYTVVIDIDGTLADFENCTEGCDYTDYPKRCEHLKREKCPLIAGAKESLDVLKEMDLNIVLFTSRIEAEREVTEAWLKQHELPYDELVMEKPRGFIIVDDLAFRFKGSWAEALHEIVFRVNKMS